MTSLTPAQPGRGAGYAGRLAMAVAVMVGAGAAAGGYLLWQENRALSAELAAVAERLERAAQEAERLEQVAAGVLEQRNQVQMVVADLGAQVLRLDARVGREPREWLAAAETEYLLRIARERLRLAQDTPGAATALRAADRRLDESGEALYQPVRHAIAVALDRLARGEANGRESLVLHMAALAGTVDALPLRRPRYTPPAAQEQAAPTAATPARAQDWHGVADAVWHDLKGLVTIRHSGERPQPLLGSEDDFLLRQRLHLKLEGVRAALLRGEALVYRATLREARDLVSAWFDPAAPDTGRFLAEVERLLALDLTAPPVDLDEPLKVLQEVQSRHQAPTGERPALDTAPLPEAKA